MSWEDWPHGADVSEYTFFVYGALNHPQVAKVSAVGVELRARGATVIPINSVLGHRRHMIRTSPSIVVEKRIGGRQRVVKVLDVERATLTGPENELALGGRLGPSQLGEYASHIETTDAALAAEEAAKAEALAFDNRSILALREAIMTSNLPLVVKKALRALFKLHRREHLSAEDDPTQ